VDAPGNDGNASMPEQAKRPNPPRKMMMMMILLLLLLLLVVVVVVVVSLTSKLIGL